MRLPEYLKQESTHTTPTMNTMSLLGISLLWGVMLNLISPWWLIVSVFSILAGYGSEVRKRDNG
jgi:hypothetical protein